MLIVFASAKLMAELFERLGQPDLVGEILAGVLIGPSMLRWIAPSDFLTAHAEALMDLAEVWQLADRREDAEASIEEAIRLFERKGNLVATDRARARLEELRV